MEYMKERDELFLVSIEKMHKKTMQVMDKIADKL